MPLHVDLLCCLAHCTKWSNVESIFKNGLMSGLAAGTSGSTELQFAPFLPFDDILPLRTVACGRVGAPDHDILLVCNRDE
eukprot:11221724-Lingulodinium_polyedra.AAC.1